MSSTNKPNIIRESESGLPWLDRQHRENTENTPKHEEGKKLRIIRESGLPWLDRRSMIKITKDQAAAVYDILVR